MLDRSLSFFDHSFTRSFDLSFVRARARDCACMYMDILHYACEHLNNHDHDNDTMIISKCFPSIMIL